MIELTEHEQTAMQVYAMVKNMRGHHDSSDPDEIAEFASMCLNTVIHLGGLVEKLAAGNEPQP